MTSYHVSPTGDDGAAGTSPETAWQTLAKASGEIYAAGDSLLFEGGETFSGSLVLDGDNLPGSGTSVTIGSYGTGRATISSGAAVGAQIRNVGAFIVRDLIFVGNGTAAVNGVEVRNTQSGSGKLQNVQLLSLDVSGYGWNGIALIGGYGTVWPENGIGDPGVDEGITAGYDNVLIQDCVAHGNTGIYAAHENSAGIFIRGRYGLNENPATFKTHTNVSIIDCVAHDNTGNASATNWTGSGIFMGQTQVGLIQGCEAYENAENRNDSAGIWAADADQITIERCESHHNRSSGASDGGGFNFDGGVTNSFLQYNWSHDNHGAGFMACNYADPPYIVNWNNNHYRYNISENDMLNNASGASVIFCGWDGPAMTDLFFYNNTVYQNSAGGALIRCQGPVTGSMTGVMANSIFYSAGGAWLFHDENNDPDGFLIRGNCWYASGTRRMAWNGTAYSTLDAWRTASGQEPGVGTDVDPLLVLPAGGAPGSYKLDAASPMIDAGLDLNAGFGIAPGSGDYFGVAIPQAGDFDVGAAEFLVFDGEIVQSLAAFSPAALPGIKVWLRAGAGVTIVDGRVSQWANQSEEPGSSVTQAAAGDVGESQALSGSAVNEAPAATQAALGGDVDISGSIEQRIQVVDPSVLPGLKVWLAAEQAVALEGGRVRQWSNIARDSYLVSQTALGELTISGEAGQTTPVAAQSGLGWVPVEGEIVQTPFVPYEQLAFGFLPVAAQTVAPFTQAVEGQRFYIVRPLVTRSIRFQGKRVKRVYMGSTLIQQFAQGSLFDAAGNQLTVELADGTQVTIEVTP